MVENFLNPGKKTDTQDAQRVPNKMKPKRFKPRHNTIKMAKVKETIEGSKRKTSGHLQGKPHKTIS